MGKGFRFLFCLSLLEMTRSKIGGWRLWTPRVETPKISPLECRPPMSTCPDPISVTRDCQGVAPILCTSPSARPDPESVARDSRPPECSPLECRPQCVAENGGIYNQVSESTPRSAKAQPPLAAFGLEGLRPSRQAFGLEGLRPSRQALGLEGLRPSRQASSLGGTGPRKLGSRQCFWVLERRLRASEQCVWIPKQ